MNDKKQLLQELDAAIDNGDLETIQRNMDALSAVESLAIQAEDPVLFSARIQKLHKEKEKMKNPRIAVKVCIAAAAVLVMGVTVYAASATNFFSFLSGDRYVTMRTTESMNEDDARRMVQDNANQSIPDDMIMESPDTQEYTFDSVDDAAKALDMELLLPTAMPDMKLEDITATSMDFGDGFVQKTCWIQYGDEAGRMMEVTTVREIIPKGRSVTSYTTHDIDDGSLDSYQSKSGVKFTILTESDRSSEITNHIAFATFGDYEYAFVFMGFEESERRAILDSIDFSAVQ